MFEEYNHLGSFYPHNTRLQSGSLQHHTSLAQALKFQPQAELDEVAIIEVLSKNYVFGDRTLVKGVQRSPWMAKPKDDRSWEYSSIPDHGYNNMPSAEIAKHLFKLLIDETRTYIGDATKVGIFLSGGMDSRMVAAALDYLIREEGKNISVCGLTWGNPESRDIVYAQRIAERLGWQWKNYPVRAAELWNNIEEVATHGCEFSALHLHAIPQMRVDQDFQVVVAGSYGDSVGRAEYAGSRVENVKPVGSGIRNFSGLLKQQVFRKNRSDVEGDLKMYHDRFPRAKSYQQNELDYQLHYMRRMLNPCFEVFGDKAKFYQCFTRQDVFGFMWGLSPQSRTDELYVHMQKLFKTDLSDIPWARTGLRYGETEGKPDSFTRHHHSYSKWLCFDLHEKIQGELLSGTLEKSGLFNMGSIEFLLGKTNRQPGYNFDYLERLVWLTSLSKMIKQYSLTTQATVETGWDLTNSKVLLPLRYQAKKVFRQLFR